MFEDPSFWVFVGFAIFVAVLLYLKVPNMITGTLDQRVDNIEKQIQQVMDMKDQAQHILNEYQDKRNNIQKEIDDIVKKAQQNADKQNQIIQEYTEKSIKQTKNAAQNRIKQMYRDNITQQRQKIALTALNATAIIITQNRKGIKQDILIQENINKLETKL